MRDPGGRQDLPDRAQGAVARAGGFDERGLPFFQRRERRARVFARRLHLRKAADDGGDFRGKLAHRLAPGSSGLAKRRLFARGGREVSPAFFELPGELDPALFEPRRPGGQALDREVDLVARVACCDPLPGGAERVRPRGLELLFQLFERGQGLGRLAVRLFPRERARPRLRDRALEPAGQVRELPAGAGLLHREIAPFALRRGAPRREVRGRPAVGLQPLVVPRDRGFEQSEALAQAIPLRRRFSGDEPGGGERCLRLTERGGRGGLGVPSLVAESFGGGERPAQNIRPDARERRAPNPERLGELLIPGGARGLPFE